MDQIKNRRDVKERAAAWMATLSISVDFTGVLVDCRVIEARPKFGRVDLLVEPLRGSGQKWVSETNAIEIAPCVEQSNFVPGAQNAERT